MSIAANLDRLRERMARAASRAGRRSEEITVVAVSKTFPASAIREAYDAGVRHFGENRVQEWETKQPQLTDLRDSCWHLVGHLQRNKARRAAELFHRIDSVDSPVLAQRLVRAQYEVAEARHLRSLFTARPETLPRESEIPPPVPLPVLVEVRLAPEETKSGVTEGDLPALAEAIRALPELDLRGLMAIPPFFEDPELARPFFRALRELRDALAARLARPLPALSMGMSHDFEVAVEEGATEVRLGTAIFGSRA